MSYFFGETFYLTLLFKLRLTEMKTFFQEWVLLVAILLAPSLPYTQAFWRNENRIKTSVFLSPMFVLGPGSVENRYYYNIDFPRGHIALKSFNGEVVDEEGNPVPLQETYLHHWAVLRYYVRKGLEISENDDDQKLQDSSYTQVRNSGICQSNCLGQYFGIGSETRKTATHVPDPFGIEVGNPTEIPEGYEEQWMLNVHAIDTRGAVDRSGCIDCRCDLYNITVDEFGMPLGPEYRGGLRCCYDRTQCKVKEGFEGVRRSLYVRYTVKWIDWTTSIVPVKIYILDVTDMWKKSEDSTAPSSDHHCWVEYEVKPCSDRGVANSGCIDRKRATLALETGGYVIYGVAHQHAGGIGSALYREDGQVICSSIPSYGTGTEAGNEAGYVVGMSTCYPPPGAVKITNGETLVLESNYSSVEPHTGVMGLFYLLIAERLPEPTPMLQTLVQIHGKLMPPMPFWVGGALLGVTILAAVATAVVVHYRLRREGADGYEAIAT